MKEKGKTKREKVWTSLLFTFSLLLFTSAANAAETVTYWDSKEKKEKTQTACQAITASTTTLKGWYFVEGNVTITHTLQLDGTAHIILKDGARLEVRGADSAPGIGVRYGFMVSDKLHIYGQEKGTGELVAIGGKNCPGIGGLSENSHYAHCGQVFVYGGHVKATGGDYAPGIGGGYYELNIDTHYYGDGPEKFHLYGGQVEAVGGRHAPGVGSAYDGKKAGEIFLYGGLLAATGTSRGLGIGQGDGGNGVCAVKSVQGAVWTDPSPTSAFSLGAGGERTCTTPYIRIAAIEEKITKDTDSLCHGRWYVVNESVERIGILYVNGLAHLVLGPGCELKVTGWDRHAGLTVKSGNSLEIYGSADGALTATGGRWAAGIGGGEGDAGGTVTINGGTVTAQGGGDGGAGIGGGDHGAGGTLTINGGTVTVKGGVTGSLTLDPHIFQYDDSDGCHYTEGVFVSFNMPSGLQLASATCDKAGGVKVTTEGRNCTCRMVSGGRLTLKFVAPEIRDELVGSETVTVGPVTANLTLGADALPSARSRLVNVVYVLQGVQKEAKAYPVIPSRTSSELLLSNDWYVATGTVTVATTRVRGEVHLILADGAELTVNGGIRVGGDDKLFIYGQVAGSGKLVANGGSYSAGIGGGPWVAGGTVTINGGTVTATGGNSGAGIGGGNGAGGGTVRINGGTVTAKGGWDGAGIGGGDHGAGGTLTINGGTVTATGGNLGAGIGGGNNANGGSVKITGGTVTARGGKLGAGIGGGDHGAGGTVTINGGTVAASGNGGGKGIGGGNNANGGSVKITGGTVEADGFNGQSLGGVVTIDGGSIKTKTFESLPKNSAGQRLHKVTVKCEGIGDQGSGISLEGLGGYGTKDIYARDGYIYLYLPDGTYRLQATSAGQTKKAFFAVMGDDANVVLGETGRFFVNGECTDNGKGDGWWVNGSGHLLSLTNSMRYVLSGETDTLCVEVLADGATVVLSNAIIRSSGVGKFPALYVANGKKVNLQMSGQTSYLFATNGVPAIGLGEDYPEYERAQLKVALAEGADRFAEIIVVNYGAKPAIAGKSSSSVEVESGNLLVKSDTRAVADGNSFAISEASKDSLLMKTGPTPDDVHFADAYDGKAFVGVVPSYKITVPPHEGIGSVVVSNDIEQLKHEGDGVYRAMQTEEVTIDFIAAEGYAIVSGGRVIIPCLTNDMTIGGEDYPWPDIRQILTVTLPETLDGETYVVTDAGAEVEGEVEVEGKKVYPVRSGMDVEIVCTAKEGWRIVSETNVVTFAPITKSEVLTAANLPQAWRLFTVTIPQMEGVHPTLTSTDAGMVETDYDVYSILSNAQVTVTFVPFENYRIAANGEKTWTLTGDVTFGEIEGFPLPTVEGIPGTDAAPWFVGEGVVAYTNETGELFITGTGAMDDFATAADIPWDPTSVTEVTIGEGVTKIGANAWAGLSGDVVVDGGVPLSRYALVGGGFAAQNIPDNMVLVSKTDLEAAGAATLTIVGGTAYVGVSVRTNGDLTAEQKSWGKVNVRSDDVEVRDGSVIIAVPANAEKGFMVLESGESN